MSSLLQLSNAHAACKTIAMARMSEPPLCTSDKRVLVGKTSIYGIPFFLNPQNLLNRHIAIVGMSGSGKTYLTKCLAMRFVSGGISNVFIFDCNGEYSDLIMQLNGCRLAMGENYAIDLLDTRFISDVKSRREVMHLIAELAELTNAERSLLAEYLTAASTAQKKTSHTSGVSKLIENLEKRDPRHGVSLASKLRKLEGHTLFRSEGKDLAVYLNDEPLASLDLSKMSAIEQRLILLFALRITACTLSEFHINEKTPRTLIIDEAWRALKNSDNTVQLLREGRKYGVGVVVVSQLLGDVIPEALGNIGCVIAFKLNSSEDFNMLEAMNILVQKDKDKVFSLPQGSCIVSIKAKDGICDALHFTIRNVCGIDLRTFTIRFKGERMKIPNNRFMEATKKLEVPQDVKDAITSVTSEKGDDLQLSELIAIMLHGGVPRYEIVHYFRSLGFSDMSISRSYSAAISTIVKVT